MGTRLRYPGVNYFTSDDEDIFRGRDEDVKKLLTRLMLSHTLVLHGESGKGKSSLVQAGLLAEIRRYNELLQKSNKLSYITLTLRMDEVDNNPANKNVILENLLKKFRETVTMPLAPLPYLPAHTDNLWYLLKQLEEAGKAVILIFDQVEELQGFTDEQTAMFGETLSGLFVSPMPDDLYREYKAATDLIQLDQLSETERAAYSNNIGRLEQPLSSRILFIVREDKLGTMSLLSGWFPDILKNDYFLLPLTEKNARKAINEPCQQNGDFVHEPFSFSTEAEDDLIEKLRNKQKDDGFFDPIELQIICSSVEKKLSPGTKQVQVADIPRIDNAIRDFYDEAWREAARETGLGSKKMTAIKQHLIEKLAVNRKRNMVLKESLLMDENDTLTLGVMEKLVRKGLVREIKSHKDEYYQLVHDRFIEPCVIDSISLRNQAEMELSRAKEKKQARWFYFGLLGLVLVVIAVLVYLKALYNARLQEAKRKEDIARHIERTGNSTLSYVLASDWNDEKKSDVLGAFLAKKGEQEKIYLSAVVSLPDDYVGIDYQGGADYLQVTQRLSRYQYDLHSGLISHEEKMPFRALQRWIQNGEQEYYLAIDSGVLKLLNKDLQPMGVVFQLDPYSADLDHISVSPGGRYILFGDELYNFKTGAKLKTMIPGSKAQNLTGKESHIGQVIFFRSDSLLCAAYTNGSIKIFRLQGEGDNVMVAPQPVAVSVSGDKKNGVTAVPVNTGATAGTGEPLQVNVLKAQRNGNLVFLCTDEKIAIYSFSDTVLLPLQTLSGHSSAVNCLALSGNDSLLLSGSDDNSCILWDIKTLSRVGQFSYGGNPVYNVYFRNNDRNFLVATADSRIYILTRGKATALYNEQRKDLYPFSEFDFEYWYAKRSEIYSRDYYRKFVDTAHFARLYTTTLNYLVSLADKKKYLSSENSEEVEFYNYGLAQAEFYFRSLTQNKKFRNGFPQVNLELITNRFAELVLPQPGTNYGDMEIPLIERDIEQFRKYNWLFLNDTLLNSYVYLVKQAILGYGKNILDSAGKDQQLLGYTRYLRDSLIAPYMARQERLKQSTFGLTESLRRTWQMLWRYYIHQNDLPGAEKVLEEISKDGYNKKAIPFLKFLTCLKRRDYSGASQFIKQQFAGINDEWDRSLVYSLLRQKDIEIPAGNSPDETFIAMRLRRLGIR